MLRIAIAGLVLILVVQYSGVAIMSQEHQINPSKNILAARLNGTWRTDPELTHSLTDDQSTRDFGERVTFTTDEKIGIVIGEKYAMVSSREKVFVEGWVTLNGLRNPFLVVVRDGNPCLLVFSGKNGNPYGEVDVLYVMLAVARNKSNDILFIGGESARLSFTAFRRAP